MTGKSTALYLSVFEYIENKVFKLKPTQFMADFGSGLRSAINRFWPDAILRGCWYHFTAAIRRKLLSLHLYKLIEENSKAKFIYHAIHNLPLLPPEFILDGYNLIKIEAETYDLYNAFKEMFRYFESFWLTLVRKNSISCSLLNDNETDTHSIIFPIYLLQTQNEKNTLSVAHLTMRTTSSLESFHSVLNRSMAKKSHFYRFVRGLKIHESRKAEKMFNLIHHKVPSDVVPRHRRDRERAERIKINTNLFCEIFLNIMEFFEALSIDENQSDSDSDWDTSDWETSDSE